jgi:hypothetical protein
MTALIDLLHPVHRHRRHAADGPVDAAAQAPGCYDPELRHGRPLGGAFAEGRWRHAAIGKAEPIRGELAWGWLLHYATGLLFAGLLVRWPGRRGCVSLTLLPALSFGVVSVLVPLCVMQPALGAGYFAATPALVKSCLRSLATHCVFGWVHPAPRRGAG